MEIDDGKDEAEADEAGEGQGVLNALEIFHAGVRVQVAAMARADESRHRAQLKSPAILASKARLRRRRVSRLKAMDIDLRKDRFNESHNNVLDDPGSGLSEREAERLQVRLKEIMDALEWKPVLGTQ